MKSLKLCCTALFITSLSACSYFEPQEEKPEVKPNQEVISFSETVIEEGPHAEPTPIGPITTFKPATAKVTLSQTYDVLVSKQIVDWHDAASGMVMFSWIPPQGSTCQKTTFPIKKYQDDKSVTYTERSIYDANNNLCAGEWQVKVIEKPANTLATANYTIADPEQTAAVVKQPSNISTPNSKVTSSMPQQSAKPV